MTKNNDAPDLLQQNEGDGRSRRRLDAKPTTAPFTHTTEQGTDNLINLPDQCAHCGAVIGPIAAKVWSEEAQSSNIALYHCPHCGHRWTRVWGTVELWLDHKPAEVVTFFAPAPITRTTDDRPVFIKVIDATDTGLLPPGGTQVHYRYALGKTGKRATGARRNIVAIFARWTGTDGQRYRWHREFEDRAAAFSFAREHGYSGIDETRDFNRSFVMAVIP